MGEAVVLPYEEVAYGPQTKSQFLRLYRPGSSSSSGKPTLWVVIHGGFWKKRFTVDTSLVHTLPSFLTEQGHCVAMIEYRKVGEPGGGWPGCNIDIILALNKLHDMSCTRNDCPFSTGQTVLVGHSAGGSLALWVACSGSEGSLRKFQDRFLSGGAASPPLPLQLQLPLSLVVAVAPICDLREGQELYRLSDEGDAIARYLACYKEYGGSRGVASSSNCCGRSPKSVAATADELPEQYAYASPSDNMPLGVDTMLVAGEDDDTIPVKSVEDFYYRYGVDRRSAQLSYLPLSSDHFQLVDAHALFPRVYTAAMEALKTRARSDRS